MRHGSQHATLVRMADRVSLQEAARRLGVSVRTVQRRIQAGALQADHVATRRGQRVVVVLDSEVREPAATTTAGDTGTSAVLDEVRAERDWLRGRVERLEETVNRLTVLLNQAQQVAQLPPVQGDTDDDRRDDRHGDDATVTRQPASHVPSAGPRRPRQERRRPSAWRGWLRRLLEG